jgi:hypothetical protein
MKVSHTQVGQCAIGDFLNILPFLSHYTKVKGEKANLALEPGMQKFAGLKQFLEYQDFINAVTFDAPIADSELNLGIYCTLENRFNITTFPRRTLGTAMLAGYTEIDHALTLRFPKVEVAEDVSQKIIVADRWSSRVMEKSGQFRGPEFYWLDYGKDIIYNLNLISQSKLPVYSTFTGIPILLNLCRIPVKVIYYEDLVNYYGQHVTHFHIDHHFLDRDIELIWYKDLH